MCKIKIDRAIVVEGKYDKIKLSSFIDGLIIETNGFRIFKDSSKKEYIKKLSEERGLLIITDSDSAGFLIRNHLKSFVDDSKIINAYIPKIQGKECRKSAPSKEGILGVEGLNKEDILQALKNCGAMGGGNKHREKTYTPTDLFNLGLSGTAGSKAKKEEFLQKLGLPKYISNSSLIKYLNTADEGVIQKAIEEVSAVEGI